MPAPKYAALFLSESREHLATCNRLLLAWERDPAAREPVGGLFRAIHNIKGMAATMGYTAVADLAHRTESLLDAVRGGRLAPSPELFQLLFRTADAIERAAEAAPSGAEQDGPAHAELLEALAAAAGGGAPTEVAWERDLGRTSEMPVPRPAAPPAFRLVEVMIRAGTAMRGARALLALRRVERLGAVSALTPPVAAFDRDDFDGRFSFRLTTLADEEAIETTLRAAGEVDTVTFQASRAAPAAGGANAGTRQIRIDLARLDAMMKQVGELVVARNRLVELARAGAGAAADTSGAGGVELEALASQLSRLVSDLQTEVVASRMAPVGEVFERFPRVVRDVARELGKRIRLETEGGEIELDRSILDELGDPLVHLIRNAADHGIETPDARAAAGRPPEGTIRLSATRERRSVAIRVSDDGRGIDRAAILARAKRDGLCAPDVTTLTDDLLLRVLARPGFSTAAAVSGISGRGVGVEVALTRARALGGSLDVRSEAGRGTTFTLRVPLTLAIVRALLAEAGGERYAVPLSYVAETIEFNRDAVTALRDREALVVRDRVMPTVHLRDLVSARAAAMPQRRPTIILEVGERRTALVVDALLGQQDIVIEPFDAPRGLPAYVGGATILADGAPALILDAAALV
ncbi:MAG TPA: chemotaxis protein CheA [Gemmatimonadales bacterium]|nr:chemotaxis protein CheA [Gemmatimonadales bacterium]